MGNSRLLLVFNRVFIILIYIICLTVSTARAVVNIDRSRIIVYEGKGDVSASLINTAINPTLVQLWVDEGDPLISPDKVRSPVIILPPIFSIDGGQQHDVKLKLLPNKEPITSEELYWLNIYQVPPNTEMTASDGQQIVMPLRIRVKIIIRPGSFSELAEEEGRELIFKYFDQKEKRLEVINPTKRVMSLASLTINREVLDGITLLPGESRTISVSNSIVQGNKNKLSWAIINDAGVTWSYYREIQ